MWRINMKIKIYIILEFIFCIGILAVLLLLILSHTGHGSKKEHAKTQIAEISSALTLYKLEYGCYPLTNPGLQLLLIKKKEAEEPFMRVIPLDTWEKPYYYFSDGNTYGLGSYELDKRKEEE